jgi:hypothetical protein
MKVNNLHSLLLLVLLRGREEDSAVRASLRFREHQPPPNWKPAQHLSASTNQQHL